MTVGIAGKNDIGRGGIFRGEGTVEDVGAAGVGGTIGTDGEVGFAVGVEVGGGKRNAEIIPSCFTRENNVGRGGVFSGEGAVEDVGAAGVGGITIGADGAVGFAVGVEVGGG